MALLHKTLEPTLKLTGTVVRGLNPEGIKAYRAPDSAQHLGVQDFDDSAQDVNPDILRDISKHDSTLGDELGIFVATWTLPNWMTAAYWVTVDSGSLETYSDEWNEVLMYIGFDSLEGQTSQSLFNIETWVRAIHNIFTQNNQSYHSAACGCSRYCISNIAEITLDKQTGMPSGIEQKGRFYTRFNGVVNANGGIDVSDSSVLMAPVGLLGDLKKQHGHMLQVRNVRLRKRLDSCDKKLSLRRSLLASILLRGGSLLSLGQGETVESVANELENLFTDQYMGGTD